MKYSIEQYPKNKDFDVSKLNEYQIYIRNNQKIYKYGKTKTCSKCLHKLPIKEFYVKDKKTGRRCSYCRDCQMKNAGVIEIGKSRFSMKIFDKGFRRCSVCKQIKPLSEFTGNKSQYGGISNNCYECAKSLHDDFVKKERENIGDFYVREYAKRIGIVDFSEDVINKLRNELEQKREPKFNVDNIDFYNFVEFATYIEKKYNNPITQTLKRISEGKSPEQCKLSQSEMRSIAYTKGKIKITDTVTGKVYLFKNTKDPRLQKMIGDCTVRKGIKTKKPVGGYRNSLWKNPLIVERI